MKLKKLKKVLPEYEKVRVWGYDENVPLFDGYVGDIPKRLGDLKLARGPKGAYIDIRYNCSDIEDHVAVFVA